MEFHRHRRGVPQVEVTFDVDANGMLHVSATDKATDKEQSIRIEASSGLSEAEIEKMRKDAQAHSAEDKRKREEIDIKNQADAVVYQTEKQIKELGDKLSDEDKGKIEAAFGRLKEAQKGNNVDEIKSALEASILPGMKLLRKCMLRERDRNRKVLPEKSKRNNKKSNLKKKVKNLLKMRIMK